VFVIYVLIIFEPIHRENQSMKMLAPGGRGGGELLSREVDKEIGNMQVQQRLRDLESMIIDLKGNTERRL